MSLAAVPASEPEKPRQRFVRLAKAALDAWLDLEQDSAPLELLTFQEVAAICKVDQSTARGFVRAGLKEKRLTDATTGRGCPRILRSDFEAWLKRRETRKGL